MRREEGGGRLKRKRGKFRVEMSVIDVFLSTLSSFAFYHSNTCNKKHSNTHIHKLTLTYKHKHTLAYSKAQTNTSTFWVDSKSSTW